MQYNSPGDLHFLMAIDPATSGGCGWAMFLVNDGEWELLSASTVHGSAAQVALTLAEVQTNFQSTYDIYVVGERPKRYATKRASHKNLDPLDEVLMRMQCNKTWTPQQWKGNVPKAVHHQRIRANVRLPAWTDSLDHNAWDAVALGLFALGVTKRGGVV